MKAHSVWMFNETSLLSAEKVISDMGKFTEKSKSKNSARKGQSFSSARPISKLAFNSQIIVIDDIEKVVEMDGNKIKHNFSDGCGFI